VILDHCFGTIRELKEAKMLPPEDFKYPALNPQ
jgi:hypothetical protein